MLFIGQISCPLVFSYLIHVPSTHVHLHCLVAYRGVTVLDHQHNIGTHFTLYQQTGNCNCMCLHAVLQFVCGWIVNLHCTALGPCSLRIVVVDEKKYIYLFYFFFLN